MVNYALVATASFFPALFWWAPLWGQKPAPSGTRYSALSVPPEGLPQQSVPRPWEQDPLALDRPNRKGHEKETQNVLQESHHTHRVSRQRRRDSLDRQRQRPHAVFPRDQRELEGKDSGEYKTRAEWHRIVVWGKLGEWAGSLKKGAFVEVEGELRYREFQPTGSDAKIRTVEIHVVSILTLDRAEKTDHEGEAAAVELTGDDDTPF